MKSNDITLKQPIAPTTYEANDENLSLQALQLLADIDAMGARISESLKQRNQPSSYKSKV